MGEESIFPQLSDQDFQSTQFLMEKRQQLLRHVLRLRLIAKRMGKLRKVTTVANVTGNCLGVAGALTAILGLSLSPVTLGASLLASTVGLVVAATGGAANLTSDLSLAFCNYKELRRVQEIANDCRLQFKEILGYLQLMRQKQSFMEQDLYDILGCSISMDRPVCFMVLFGAHDFLVPRYSEEATKVSQAVLKAKVQRLVETIEACVNLLDEICQYLRKTATEK
ncbi:apolipoprotein L domain-containing protein 1 [Rhinophrynus dorsalis]